MKKYFWTVIFKSSASDYGIIRYWPGKIIKLHHHPGYVVIFYAIPTVVLQLGTINYKYFLGLIIASSILLYAYRQSFANFFRCAPSLLSLFGSDKNSYSVVTGKNHKLLPLPKN